MKPWLRPLPFMLMAACGLSRAGRTPVDDTAPNRSAALASALAPTGLACAASDIAWIDGPSGVVGAELGKARALVRGRMKDDVTADIFLVTARLSPEGRLLDVSDVYDVSRTSSAEETVPIVHGSLAAYAVTLDGRPEAIHVLDLNGHGEHATDDLSRFERMQVKLQDLQALGQMRGVRRTVFSLEPVPRSAELAFRPDGALTVRTENKTFVLDPTRAAVTDGAQFVRVTPEQIAKPPTFAPWMSDRLRAVSWFGDEKNQALKAVVFTGVEWFKNAKSKLTGDKGEKEAEEDMEAVAHGNAGAPSYVDPTTGWPPKPLEPFMKPGLPGEGQWVSLDKDPFITPIPGVPSPFVTTFVRTDPAAQHTRVYVTLWDPRLISLHMEAGTVEPVRASGEAGPGVIPRTPEVMRHVVAGFNGGFQATHGEYGMQANGILYLPPKAYAATVLELRDGTTAFGAWPRSPEIPEEVLSFRQNMTALVQNGKYNPWGRAWWGGVPPGWHDATHTTRSGICMTTEGFVGYFYGNDIGPEPLGRAMLVARCAFGIHLDMNPGLAGFEFYNSQPAQNFQPLGRPLQSDWEYEGSLKDMPSFKFRARRMVKSMGHMLFPRYMHRDARDFFYLTTRSVLPGAPIAGDADATFRVKGLPQHGYPYALAIANARLGIGERKVRVLRIDPRTVAVDTSDAPTAQDVAVFGRPGRSTTDRNPRGKNHDAGAIEVPPSDRKLWLTGHVFTIDKNGPTGAGAIVNLLVPASAPTANARAAVGISDEDGMLQWVELAPEDKADYATSEAMLKLLERLGCSSRGLVAGDLRAFLGGSLDTAGNPETPSATLVRLVRTVAPGARPMFESTEIVGPAVWTPLQQQRVKWRPTLAPPDKPAASASGAAPSATP